LLFYYTAQNHHRIIAFLWYRRITLVILRRSNGRPLHSVLKMHPAILIYCLRSYLCNVLVWCGLSTVDFPRPPYEPLKYSWVYLNMYNNNNYGMFTFYLHCNALKAHSTCARINIHIEAFSQIYWVKPFNSIRSQPVYFAYQFVRGNVYWTIKPIDCHLFILFY